MRYLIIKDQRERETSRLLCLNEVSNPRTNKQAASALFTLDGARGEALTRRLARSERRRRHCRAGLAIIAILLLVAAIGAVELLMSRGQRVFGAVLQ
ncbi:unnamed protein product [Arctia plantaginis]|uniref:Uncharacterized protein n=1 Tax=Arctia plantaginis TaxID=874455 RepID=A0A8S1BE60_ARCPL|nr:unnamed protein product [Arctia plantaginis]